MKTKLIFPLTNVSTSSTDGTKEGTNGSQGIQRRQGWEREKADVNWDGCEYSKCGRTDKGVSAFGQVIGVRVRSNQRVRRASTLEISADVSRGEHSTITSHPDAPLATNALEDTLLSDTEDNEPPFDPVADELPYIQLLNRVLPPDIRILAWCPNPPSNFSARFSCKERRYKYFFTNPGFAPVPGPFGLYSTPNNPNSTHNREGWLDIDAMREACSNIVGLHDFRNFCKIDASKQLTNFQRRIFHADIEEVSPLSLPSFLSHLSLLPPSTTKAAGAPQPKLYALVIHGSAFLWHQVRSLAAIVFLVGQGLESPTLISQLLDISANPTKPKYEMATDAPLVLWDCIFPVESEVQSAEKREIGYEDSLEWIYIGEKGGVEGGVSAAKTRGKWGRGGIVDDLWEVWRAKKMDELIASQLLDVVSVQGHRKLGSAAEEDDTEAGKKGYRSPGARVFDGGDVARLKGSYIPVLKKERMEAVEIINARYAAKMGWDPASPTVRDQDADE